MAVSSPTVPNVHAAPEANASFYEKLNTGWHERALQGFMFIVLAHWGEHLVQAYQIYVMGWPRPMANGILGLWYPWLIKSETLHYGYALIMLTGIWVLRKGFTGRSRAWLQFDRIHSHGHRDVLPHVPLGERAGENGLHLRLGPQPVHTSRLIR